jgi:hypothetical protein
MNSGTRLLTNLLAALSLAAAAFLIATHWDQTVPVSWFGQTAEPDSLGLLLVVVAGLVGLSLGLKLWEMVAHIRKTRRQSERQLERAEVTAEVSTDKVRALEAKIATLEQALAKALGSSGQSA